MKLLGIETSCDETAVAIVEDGRRILAQVVASQIPLHARYGGVVPEVASREHLLTILPVLRQCLEQAQLDWAELQGIAVTYGPGLAGSLLVGLSVAKAIAFARGLPLIPVNHLEGHLYANWLKEGPEPLFPAVGLVVSGAHSDLLLMEDHGRYRALGSTRDDAAGEAFDKAARLLGLGYPGGPAIQRAAQGGEARRYPLPRAWLPGTDDFSFSGLKTALLRQAIALGLYEADRGPIPQPEPAPAVPHLAAAFQEAVAEVLVVKAVAAAQRVGARSLLLAGGVAANLRLRQLLQERSPVPLHQPPIALCTDNGAMIAAAAAFHGPQRSAFLSLDIQPTLRLG